MLTTFFCFVVVANSIATDSDRFILMDDALKKKNLLNFLFKFLISMMNPNGSLNIHNEYEWLILIFIFIHSSFRIAAMTKKLNKSMDNIVRGFFFLFFFV